MRVLVCLVLVIACGGDKQDGPVGGSNAPVTSSPDDDIVDRALTSIATIADLATRHAANCDALAKDLAVHANRDAQLIRDFKKLLADPVKQQVLAARFGERIQQVGHRAITSLRAHCATHAAIANVFKQLE